MAVTSYNIMDEALAPSATIVIDYKGKNPFRLYHALPAMMQTIFHGRGKNIFERSFKWDITSDPREYSFEMWFDDWKFDGRSKPQIRVRVHGQQPSDPESPNGICKIEIKAWLNTGYNFGNEFEKMIGMSFIWLYHRVWYNNIRRRYMQIIREGVYKLEVAIRDLYGITLETPELTGGPPRLYKLA